MEYLTKTAEPVDDDECPLFSFTGNCHNLNKCKYSHKKKYFRSTLQIKNDSQFKHDDSKETQEFINNCLVVYEENKEYQQDDDPFINIPTSGYNEYYEQDPIPNSIKKYFNIPSTLERPGEEAAEENPIYTEIEPEGELFYDERYGDCKCCHGFVYACIAPMCRSLGECICSIAEYNEQISRSKK